MKLLYENLGIEQIKTTAYHPLTNGVLEHLHGTLESILRKTLI